MEVRYEVYPEHRVCVCYIEKCKWDALFFINKYFPRVSADTAVLMPNRFKGVAKCDEEDEFDETFGKDLAFDKAYEKYMNSFTKRIAHYINFIDKELDNFIEFVKTCRKTRNWW